MPLGALLAMTVLIASPEVHPDRTVTFRLRALNALKVEVGIEGQSSLAMKKGEDGVWTVTCKPLDPDIYGYSFNVDGSTVLDPLNPAMKPNLIWASNLVTVPGNRLWEVRNVPHGTVHRHFYKSGVIGDERDYYVYTPPGYNSGKAKLPALYLLHGYSDTAVGWTEVGKAHVILDNLLAEGKIKPMIVVMPLGYGVPDFASGNRGFGNLELVMENYGKFTEALLTEVIPAVQKDYRVSDKREDRAIAGLSMGGSESLFAGLKNPDKFGSIGAFSTGGLRGDAPTTVFKDIDLAAARKLKTFYVSCGTEDSLHSFHKSFTAWLKKVELPVEVSESKGGHVWMLWRADLIKFAPKLFR